MSVTEPPAADPRGRQRRWIIAIACVVVVGIVAAILVAALGGGDDPSATAPPTTSATSSASAAGTTSTGPKPSASASATRSATATATKSASPSATPSTATASPKPPEESSKAIPTRKAVPIKSPAAFGGDVHGRHHRASSRSGVPASAPGEISGPAIKVGITINNDTADPLVLAQTTVNAYYGPRQAPATAIFGDPSSKPFAGTAAPGASAKGVYVFDVPRAGRGDVTITVSYAPLSPIVVFRGSVR